MVFFDFFLIFRCNQLININEQYFCAERKWRLVPEMEGGGGKVAVEGGRQWWRRMRCRVCVCDAKRKEKKGIRGKKR
ncbi:hypothetical protein HanRHA438_Chr07g0289071 [Helianthus annuus]|nr:hypothetical protein HanRHA438_Chr07g0289071 [Helianthus annuus]